MDEGVATIRIDRPLYEHQQLRQDFNYSKTKSNCLKKSFVSCETFQLKRFILKTLPIISWLPHYKWRKDISSDIISGFTVAIMHIPQGMAYGLLGNVPPVIGIYMAFFPVLVYFFLGTSRHTSMGTFAVVCLMTGKAVLEHSHPSYFRKDLQMNDTNQGGPNIQSLNNFYSPVQVATTVTFTAALFQLGMYLLRLGSLSAVLSETLISGFTTGAAFQVIVSQIKDLLGLNISREKGFFVVIKTLKNVFQDISTVNYAAVIISAVTIIISSLNNEILKPIVAKKSSFPIPIELIAIIVGTLVSKYANFSDTYGIAIVGEIPNGLPVPTAPPFSLISSVWLDAFSIAVVSYSITLSMALIFAQKLNYEIDPNQELLAQGMGNIFGSFFSCMPFSASLSRSMIQQTVGGRTQIASLISCMILLIILLWIGPFFEPLPKSVLASVIVVALKGMIMQVTEFVKFLKLSKLDAIVWMSTFLTVVIVSIDIGLLVGVMMSLGTMFLLNFKPYTCLLGNVPQTDIYIDASKYKDIIVNPAVKIFHYRGALNFATRNIFRTELFRLVNINPQKEIGYMKKLTKYAKTLNIAVSDDVKQKLSNVKLKLNKDLRCIVLDFSGISYLDPSGASTLKIIIDDFNKINIPVYIVACSESTYELLCKTELTTDNEKMLRIFSTVHDAVKFATGKFLDSNLTISAACGS